MAEPEHAPGSPEAVAQGCTCPRIDNGHGRGVGGDGERHGWWITSACPMHDPNYCKVPKPKETGE